MEIDNPVVKPGFLEVYCGPVKSGKTGLLIKRVDKTNYMQNTKVLFLNPAINTRDTTIKSRFGTKEYDFVSVNETKPYSILKHVKKKHKIIAIDEAQFFGRGIVEVVEALLQRKKNIIVAGLDLNFKAEPFGYMPNLLSIANIVEKCSAVCDYGICNQAATRSQLLIDNKPAHYNTCEIQIDDGSVVYEARCLKHHIVPGKPKI